MVKFNWRFEGFQYVDFINCVVITLRILKHIENLILSILVNHKEGMVYAVVLQFAYILVRGFITNI